MPRLYQYPAPGASILKCAGDILSVTLSADGGLPPGAAFVRTTIPAESRRAAPGFPWRDIAMSRRRDGSFIAEIPLRSPGVFAVKALFVPDSGDGEPFWPDGDNLHVKVAPARTRRSNSIYTAFVRQFSSDDGRAANSSVGAASLDAAGWNAIPPSGTFRELGRRLDHIVGDLGFRIIQLLPIHPVPTTYARMGRFGSPFASLDFFSVDPALAEFDGRTTPLDQFVELVDAVHGRGASIFLDLPANHTGWASTLQTRHPEFFRRNEDGSFHSPGAWGVTWADLVELDFGNPAVADAMADVFLFWCAKGVDGFRCDAGYMIPAEAWDRITSRVRMAFPDTVFLLEGLGGKLETTDDLIAQRGLDWAYSEIFQQYDRGAIEWYLGGALPRSESIGPLVNFAETHDNDRLAAKGRRYASMRTALAALLSQQGAFGITAGVEWFCADKIDVHGAAPLNWDAADNQIALISRLNAILDACAAFKLGATVEIVTQGGSNAVAALRRCAETPAGNCLVAVNLDRLASSAVEWRGDLFSAECVWDIVSGKPVTIGTNGPNATLSLPPGGFVALVGDVAQLRAAEAAERRRRDCGAFDWPDADDGGQSPAPVSSRLARTVRFRFPTDARRDVPIPPGYALDIESPMPFRALAWVDGGPFRLAVSSRRAGGTHSATLDFSALAPIAAPKRIRLEIAGFGDGVSKTNSWVTLLPSAENATVSLGADRNRIAADPTLQASLANRRGAAAQAAARWGEIRSQYDALLALNPDPAVPSNRQVFFTRCRAWVRYRGYSFALDSTTQSSFGPVSSHEATWRFSVPSPGGGAIGLAATLCLAEDANRIRLSFSRIDSGDLAPGEITLVMRPDIEARDFHGPTRAYTGPESAFPASISPRADGFVFSPPGRIPCEMRLVNGRFTHEPEWTYCVPHPVEAGRGLEPDGDVFSPGWFSVRLANHCETVLEAGELGASGRFATPARLPVQMPFLSWVEDIAPDDSLGLFLADRDENTTVIAGYPWFLDWGRDTLIALRGLVAAGRTDVAASILTEFARFEEKGTLPNIIHGTTVGNRDTSDAPLWFVVAACDLMDAVGADQVAAMRCGSRTIGDVVKSILRGYAAGTPNGVRADPESGLVFSPSHFTWMDTNYPAGTPRAGYPVDIQALWIAALDGAAKRLGEDEFAAMAAKAKSSLGRFFALPGAWLADCLRTPDGRFAPASGALPEDAIRPNQILAVTLGAVKSDTPLARGVVGATANLLVPGAIRSLDDARVQTPQPIWREGVLLNDPNAPYWGRYEGDEDTRRKPAYHNGTAWGWQFPMWCEAYAMTTGDVAAAKAWLASVAILAGGGSVGHLPEIVDGDAPHTQRGCLAQAWSLSEVVRVWRKLQI